MPSNNNMQTINIDIFISILTIIIIVIVCILIKIIIKKNKKISLENKIKYQAYLEELSYQKSKDINNYKNKYKKKYLLTLNEKNQYLKIKSVTDKLGLYLFAKVRLADIIEPIEKTKNWKSLWYKIQSKHIDFFICKPTMATLCVIEIDDNSHNQQNRKERDKFVDFILTDNNIPVIRCLYVQEESLEIELKKLLNQ